MNCHFTKTTLSLDQYTCVNKSRAFAPNKKHIYANNKPEKLNLSTKKTYKAQGFFL